MRDEALDDVRHFIEVIDRLRAPGGCPWDRQQTHESLAPFLLEETYEALEAMTASPGGSGQDLKEELGDLLLQVAMHSAIAAETRDSSGGFDIGDVAATVTAKMIHRHPHVFGDVAVSDAADVVVNWEKLKASEKPARESLLDGIPAQLPALAHAQSVQRRPARIGFEPTPDVATALAIVRHAVDDLGGATPAPPSGPDADGWVATDGGFARGENSVSGDSVAPPDPATTELVGDLLFATVALARRLGVDAEEALRARSRRFAANYRRVEERARADGVELHHLDPAQWTQRWDDASVDS